MVWLFERGPERAVFEVRQGSGHFEIAVRWPDGTETIDRVQGAAKLLSEIERIPERLSHDGWRPRPGDLLLLSASTMTV
jgi:hypothetical protein